MDTWLIILLSMIDGMAIGSLITLASLPAVTPSPVSSLLRLALGAPAFHPPADWDDITMSVTSIENIPYDKDKGMEFDMYWPIGSRPCDHPCILWVHGGGFVGGSRRLTTGPMMVLASKGFTVINMDYGLAPRFHHPRQVLDVDSALSKLESLPENIRPDVTNGIILGGDSAGAHIVSEYAALALNGKSEDIGVALRSGIKVRALVLYCGLYDFKTLSQSSWWKFPVKFFTKQIGWAITGNRRWWKDVLTRRMDVTSRITPDYPPCFLADGNFVTFDRQMDAMDTELETNGIKHMTMRFPRSEHGRLFHEFQFDYRKQEAASVLDGTVDFLNDICKKS